MKGCRRAKELLTSTAPTTQSYTSSLLYLGVVYFCSEISEIVLFEILSVLTPQFLQEQLWPHEQELGPPQLQVDPQSQAMMTDVKL